MGKKRKIRSVKVKKLKSKIQNIREIKKSENKRELGFSEDVSVNDDANFVSGLVSGNSFSSKSGLVPNLESSAPKVSFDETNSSTPMYSGISGDSVGPVYKPVESFEETDMIRTSGVNQNFSSSVPMSAEAKKMKNIDEKLRGEDSKKYEGGSSSGRKSEKRYLKPWEI